MSQNTEVITDTLVSHSNDLTLVKSTQEKHYLKQATADNTRRAYQAAIRQYEQWGGFIPADELQIARYLTNQAQQLKPTTLSLHLTALSQYHRYLNLPDPTQSPYIRKLLKGIQREHGQPKRKAKALRAQEIETLINYLNNLSQTQEKKLETHHLKAIRDSALIQVAYFAALRRSELVSIEVSDLKFESEGLLLLIPKSKTDPTRKGIIKALPYGNTTICPVKSIKHWLNASQITEGLVFRSINRWGQLQNKALHPDSINLMMKSLAKACQLDCIDLISSHSLRRGFATSAARAGADFMAIKKQGGWQNDHTVREYIEEGLCFEDNAARTLLDRGLGRNGTENRLKDYSPSAGLRNSLNSPLLTDSDTVNK